jgi:hypothetical protein
MKLKESIIILLFITGVLSPILAQQASTDTLLGELTFNEIAHDFGHIQQNGTGVVDFVFENTGGVVVKLSNVHSSCGCTIPTWPHESILPGEKSKITVKYDTKRLGAFSKTITVYTNIEGGSIKLQIKGVVEPL